MQILQNQNYRNVPLSTYVLGFVIAQLLLIFNSFFSLVHFEPKYETLFKSFINFNKRKLPPYKRCNDQKCSYREL